ncbi:MAG: hypothetical protein J0G37_19545 [Afipia sp.]|nr:hypothetical protein [Afipia sp.]
MRRTPVYIVCSPRPAVGKTLIARALTEFLLLQHGAVTAFDINLREPSLLDYLPGVTETAQIGDTFGQMALMDRLIVNDGQPKVVDLGFHAFDDFFRIIADIGFMKEADRRGVDPIVLFIPDRDRAAATAWTMLRATFPSAALVPVENEYVLWGELPRGFGGVRPFRVAALPAFLKSIIGRLNFSFTRYLRADRNEASELHQWVRANYTRFRELELNLILHKL